MKCKILNNFEHFSLFISGVSEFVSIFEFYSLIGIHTGIASSAVG